MIDFKCRPIWSSYFFSFAERKNGLGDEELMGQCSPLPELFGLEPPLYESICRRAPFSFFVLYDHFDDDQLGLSVEITHRFATVE